MPWPQGTGPGQVEITGRDPIVITWHLSPTSDVVQNFTLSYRALGVVRQGDAGDVLDWQALPDEYEYDIASSTVTVSYPAGATRQGEPEVTAGKAEAATGDGQVVFTQGNLSSGDPLVVRLNFAPGSFSDTLPTWQAQSQAQSSRAWIWITAAVVTLAGGLMAVIVAARPYQRTIRKSSSFLHKPPMDLPPALAGWLFNQTISWQHGLATLFDLAERGLIRIEETAEKKWYESNQFAVTLLNRSGNLRPHENALWDNPPMASANGNWTQPVNYAEGTLHLRAEIFSIPVPQDDMKLQLCFWQYNNARENCTQSRNVPGRAGTVVEWSVPVQGMWKKGGVTIDWVNPRDRNGFAIKNGDGQPVSSYSGWNWNGEDPNAWYPMNVRFTVVVVEKGKTFSGWNTYIP